MDNLFTIVAIILILSVFVIDYFKTKKLYTLFGIPIVFYFFVVMPLLKKSGVNENVTLVITIIMIVIAFVYAYKGIDKPKKVNK